MEVLFPNYTKFSDLFDDYKVIEDLGQYKSRSVHTIVVDELLNYGKVRPSMGRASINSFCSVRGRTQSASLDVVPNADVIAAVCKNMFLGDQYVINFNITIRSDKVALVSAHYNMITGSRWFAFITTDSIPKD